MKRSFSKIVSTIGILTLALIIGLSACAPAPAPAAEEPAAAAPAAGEPAAATSLEGKVLAVFMPSADHGFTAESIAQAKSELETLSKEKGFEFKQVTSAEASDQANQIATVLEGQVDTVLLWPIDGAPLRSAAESIKEKNIPLVVYDRLIPDFEPNAQMTGDQITIGTQAAKYFNTFFADQLKTDKVYILEFQGDNSMAAQERSSSFVDNKDPNIEIAQSFTTNWQRDVGRQQMETFLSSSKVEDIEKIQAIYTHDDEPMLGILDAIRDYNGEAKLNIKILTGVGAQKATLDEMQKAKDEDGIDVMSYTYAPGMIRLAVDLAVDTMEGKGKTGLQLVPVYEIRLDNQAEYRTSAEYMHRYEEGTMPEAAAPAATSLEGKVLAVFMPSADHGFTAESIAQAKSELETLSKEKGFEFKQVTSAEASDQANQIATVLEGQVDTVLLWPIDGAPLRSAAESIKEKNIPLVVYDRLIPDFEPNAQMTGDQITIGTQAAKYFNTFFADQLKTDKVYILEFQGDNSMAAQERSSSFVDNKDPNIEIAQSFTTNWQRDVGRQQMETFLSSSKVEDIEKIQAIYTHDDEPMLGILDAIRDYNGEAKLNIKILTGVGAQKATLDEMQKAKDEDGIDVMSYTYAPGMIRLAVDLAVDTMEGKGKTGLQLVPVYEIRLDNQAEYRTSAEYKHRYEE